MKRSVLVLAVCLFTMQGAARAANLLTNGDFGTNDLTGWSTWTETGGVATFSAASGAATIVKGAGHGENWTTGVIYQVVSVPAGTQVQLTGSWAGDQSAHGSGDWWWAEAAVYSLPTSYPLNNDPTGDGFVAETTFAGGQDTYLHATFDYTANVANFGGNGGTYIAATDYLNTVNGAVPAGDPSAVWSMEDIAGSYYDWTIAQPYMVGLSIWDTLHRQAYNVPGGIVTSLGEVVVAIKYGSQFDDSGSLSFDNFALTVVPEPSSAALALIGVGLFFARGRRKQQASA